MSVPLKKPSASDSETARIGRGSEVPVTVEHKNLDLALIQITEDKLRLCLRDYIDSLHWRWHWVGALGTSVSLFIAVQTAEFRDFLGKGGPFWEAVFFIAAFLTAGVAAFLMFKHFQNRGSLEKLVNSIKNSDTLPANLPKFIRQGSHVIVTRRKL